MNIEQLIQIMEEANSPTITLQQLQQIQQKIQEVK